MDPVAAGDVASTAAVGPATRAGTGEPITYPEWVARYDTLDDDRQAAIGLQVDALADPPTFSVILPVHDTPAELLRDAIDSVRAQLYPHWELCIADDCSRDPAVPKVLDEYAGVDPRVKVVHRDENGHISAASNTALALATGRWVAFFDHDDILAAHALALGRPPGWPSRRRRGSTATRTSSTDGGRPVASTSSRSSIRCCCSPRTTSPTLLLADVILDRSAGSASATRAARTGTSCSG